MMTGMAETKDFLSTSEYAAKLGVTPMRVRRLCQDGRIPGAKKIGRDWVIPAGARPIPGTKGPAARWEIEEMREENA